jgi:hypothetical protein
MSDIKVCLYYVGSKKEGRHRVAGCPKNQPEILSSIILILCIIIYITIWFFFVFSCLLVFPLPVG